MNSFCNSLFYYFAFCFTSSVVCFLSTAIYVLLMQRDIYLNEKEHRATTLFYVWNLQAYCYYMCYHHLAHIWFSSFLLYFGGLCRGKGYPRSLLNFYFPHKNVFKLLESCFLLVQFSVVWNTCTQFLPLSPHLSLSLFSTPSIDYYSGKTFLSCFSF